ncbi:methylmalonyl Co-A mutase-associated GTPase MeaB [Ramlibacter albus]|uniref:methylmalonyl Co-A mutase-associated GTPase MeaB n=1 Tax=Ramlibacter albus TaxID=2079448 RepID=UPI001C9BB410
MSVDRLALARTLSRIERGDAVAFDTQSLGRAHVVGITGAPGAGKSTLVNLLLGEWLSRGRKTGVLAVDPSSPITGGAVLGDRVRMGEHGAHGDVFIRSVASRGHLGGLAQGTRTMVDALDAAGFDVVLVETVGAGQSEVEIVEVADTRIVACPPGLGDDVQSIKAGILEIADILVVTKSDLPSADRTMRDLRDMLHLRAAAPEGAWKVPVLGTSTQDKLGVPELADRIAAHAQAAGRGRRLTAVDPVAGHVHALWARDPFAQSLGVRLRGAGSGTATVALTLQPSHINFNGTCHGGVTFSLADTAFGLASNSHGVIAAGIDAHITYQNPATTGDTLVARAVEVSRSKKLAVYRVDVTRESDGAALCSFTGTVYRTERPN